MEGKTTLFTLYGASCRENAQNSLYPNEYRIKTLDDFLSVADRDFVCAKYKDNRRGLSNFIGSDCICMDCDNTHSDNPSDWKTPDDVSLSFPDVPFIVHYSRNHMKVKNGKAARPKFHILFPTAFTTDSEEYRERKENILKRFPFFDSNAVDNARFFFGTASPTGAIYYGSVNPEDLPEVEESYNDTKEDVCEDFDDIPFVEGQRNNMMHKRAVSLLKRYGNKKLTLDVFKEEAAQKCKPPLSNVELKTIWDSAKKFYEKTIAKSDSYVAPDKYKPNSVPFVIADKNGNCKISCPALASFIRKNVHYRITRNFFMQMNMIYVYEDGVYRAHSADTFKGVIKQVIADNLGEQFIKMRDVDETYRLLATDLGNCTIDDFNQDESIINFKNGLLEVSADCLVLKSHSPEVLSTIQLPCNWSENEQETPYFDKYIDDISNGDSETRNLILQLAGVALSNVKASRMKSCPFFYGDGNTGKSVLKALIEKLLGDGNYMSIDLKSLEERFGTGDIVGKRLIGSADMSFMKLPEMDIFKKLTGGDSVRAEHKGLPAYTFTFTGMLWFCMNSLPKFGGDKGTWVYDRIIPIHCERILAEDVRDHFLLEHMYAEREGIIQKCVNALQDVIRNGYRYSLTSKVRKEREAYMDDNDSVRMFFKESLVRKDSRCGYSDLDKTSQIFSSYRNWCCDNNNGFSENLRNFNKTLCDCLNVDQDKLIVHRKDGNHYQYVRLKENPRSEFLL